MEALLIIWGSITAIVLGSVGLNAWKAVRLRQGFSSGEYQALQERLHRIEADLDEIKDTLADLVIQDHDEAAFRRLEASVEQEKQRLTQN